MVHCMIGFCANHFRINSQCLAEGSAILLSADENHRRCTFDLRHADRIGSDICHFQIREKIEPVRTAPCEFDVEDRPARVLAIQVNLLSDFGLLLCPNRSGDGSERRNRRNSKGERRQRIGIRPAIEIHEFHRRCLSNADGDGSRAA